MNVIKQSYKYTKGYRWAMAVCIVLGWVGVISALLLPLAPQLLIDRIINPLVGADAVYNPSNPFGGLLDGAGSYWAMFGRLLAIFGIISLARYTAHYLRWNTAHHIGPLMEGKMRYAAFDKMLTQSAVVTRQYTSGDLLSIVNIDPIVVKNMFFQDIPVLIDQVLLMAVAIYFLWIIDPVLIILPIASGAVTAVTVVRFIKAMRVRFNKIRQASIDLNSCISESINGVRIVKSYAAENVETEKFDKLNEGYCKAFCEQANTDSKYQTIFLGISQTLAISSTILGVVLAVTGRISLGEYTTFMAYVFMLSGPLGLMARIFGQMQNAFVAGSRMHTFIDTGDYISQRSDAKPITDKPHIRLEGVSVALEDSEKLVDIDIDIPYGKSLGVMGRTGAGKTVLVKALTRLHDAAKGEVTINGVNVKDCVLEDVYRQYGIVFQEVFLFSNSVDANIAFYDPKIAHEKVVEAAEVSEADKFIRGLKDGYDTIVGEKGIGLSGGQKQRISIARALVKNPPVLILDDSTSALDLSTERRVFENIKTKYPEKTIIITSHRASSVEHCDEIVYLEDGHITERGTHNELMALGGSYSKVYKQQSASR